MNQKMEFLLNEAQKGVMRENPTIEDKNIIQEKVVERFGELIVRECGKSCTLQGDEADMFQKFGISQF